MAQVKICGITTPENMQDTLSAGADYIGLNFYAPSPRSVTPDQAEILSRITSPDVKNVALVVDAGDDLLGEIVSKAEIDLIQLHGSEDPRRVAEIRERFQRPVMKVGKVAEAADLEAMRSFEDVADYLLFDAKAPKGMKNALPGGNALSFDWTLLAGTQWKKPWMLAGGLHPDNVAEAIRLTGCPCVDVASGVESKPGLKDPEKMKTFIQAAKGL